MANIPRNIEVATDDCLPNYQHVFKPDVLQDQVAFITGGGSGIGFRIAEILMRHGCDTAIASRRLSKVQESAAKLEKATGRKCIAMAMDVRNPNEVVKCVDNVLDKFGKIDILVNNAAGNFVCDAEHLSYNAFRTVIEIDTLGTFNASKAVFEKYFKDHGGSIINISANLHYSAVAMQVHAGSAKAAIDAMTKHLAVEWGCNGVRVNCIAPGPTEGTEGIRRLYKRTEGTEHGIKSIPLQRMGQKYEIGDAAVYLASNAGSYITGTVLLVDGGSWLARFNNFSVLKQQWALVKGRL